MSQTPDQRQLQKPSAALPEERRGAPRRRMRDRIASLDRTDNPSLKRRELANLVLLVEDDLRETALALGQIEQYLGAAMTLLEQPELDGDQIATMASDARVSWRLDALADNITNLRHRMASIATAVKNDAG
jgi:hypothetical protein